MQLDISDYDGNSVAYTLLVGRNYFSDGIGNDAVSIFRETGTFYVSTATSFDNLIGWDN